MLCVFLVREIGCRGDAMVRDDDSQKTQCRVFFVSTYYHRYYDVEYHMVQAETPLPQNVSRLISRYGDR